MITVAALPSHTVTLPVAPWRPVVVAAFALATLSLLLPSVPTYDPWAWLIWGREIAHGELVTTGGPSWKPLPVMFTAPFSLLGDSVAPLAWLAVARAGGLVAVAMAYRLAARLAGPVAGVVAAVALLLCDGFVFTVARGNSEGILVAVCLAAVERHLDGRRLHAGLLGVAAALLRPEVWPLLAVHAVLVVRHDRSRQIVTLVAAGAALVAVLWFGPELVGSGDLMRAASRARQPNLDAAAFDAHPFLAVFRRSAGLLTLPVYVGAGAAVVIAWRRRDRLVLTLAAVATVLMVTVGAMTQAGFAGNLRYVVLPAAVVCVLSGAGWIGLSHAAWRRRGRAGSLLVVACAAALAVAPVRADLRALQGDARAIASEAALDGSLPHVIARAGGRAVVLACGTVYTGAFQTQAVVWHLRVPQTSVEVDLTPTPPGTVVAPNFTGLARSSWFTPIARTPHWTVRSSCR